MTNTTALPKLLRLIDPGLREHLEALPASAALIGISTDGRAIAVDLDAAPHILACSGTSGGSTTILRTLTAQFLHQGARALVLDTTRLSHLWAKDLPTVTHRGNAVGIHDALVGLGSELKHRTDFDGDLDGVPRLMVVIDRADDTLRHLARYWETFRREDVRSGPRPSPPSRPFCTRGARPASTSSTTDPPPSAVDLIPGAASSSPPSSSPGSTPAPGSGSPR
ncbi:hypothetical protein [Streptomyces sp. NPDC048720]|uniref:hypothetical protein n=1 Tax=Streptomyces sp. NPDC048720 TaxID=3365588 RepID=UPI00371B44EF